MCVKAQFNTFRRLFGYGHNVMYSDCSLMKLYVISISVAVSFATRKCFLFRVLPLTMVYQKQL